MSEQSQQFLEQLREAVATDQLKLPSLPDVALHIRKALESETGSPVNACQRPGLNHSLNIMEDERHRLAIEQTAHTLSVV